MFKKYATTRKPKYKQQAGGENMKEITIQLQIPDDKKLNLNKFKRLLKRKLSAEYKIIQPTRKMYRSKGFNL